MFLGTGITTSRRQRRAREGVSEGSRSAKKRALSHARTEAPVKDYAYGTDYAELFGATGSDAETYDLNGDNTVDFRDFFIFSDGMCAAGGLASLLGMPPRRRGRSIRRWGSFIRNQESVSINVL